MNAYFGALLSVFILMNICFLFALKIRRNDLADVIWGPGFVVAALGALAGKTAGGFELQMNTPLLVILSCLTIWALRLFFHLGLRTFKKEKEDIRYQQMREKWGANWKLNSYLYVFLLQGFFMLVVALPVIQMIHRPTADKEFSLWIGALLWFLGFLFESISDLQLKKFKAKPENKGRIMIEGLWSWSRHPNYFGEVLQWWGLYIMAFQIESWWFTVLSPITITFLILKVSGVPMLEELMKSRPGYLEYQKRTSSFLPWPPQKQERHKNF